MMARIDAILADAERWTRDSLRHQQSDALVDRDRRRLATDIHELHQLSAHLPFESSRHRLKAGMLRALEAQLCLFLPLASAVEDRVQQLQANGSLSLSLRDLLEDAVTWLARVEDGWTASEIDILRHRARACEPDCAKSISWETALELSLLDRLAELIAVHGVCRELRDAMAQERIIVSQRTKTAIHNSGRRMLHRDHGLAFRGALTTTLTVLIGCAFWITAAWPAGAGAVVIASIICALFSNMDDPAPTAWKVWQGTCGAVAVAAVYAFAILPRVSDFVVLIAVMAPAFLTMGVMMVNRRTAAIAIGMILSLPGLMGLDAAYTSSFGVFANAAIAQVFGALLAALVLGAVRTIGAEKASLRLMRAGWRDLAGRAGPRQMPDTAKWINTMLDRIGLLTPRLVEIGGDTSTPLLEILRDTRVGISLDELQRLRRVVSPTDARLLALVLGRVRQHYARKLTAGDRADDALVRTIDLAMSKFSSYGVDEKRLATLALTSLRRNVVS